MTKLSNGIEYNNPNLQPAFAEYLLNNFFEIELTKDSIVFKKDRHLKIFIRGTSADFMVHDPVAIEWVYKTGFVGLDGLDINGFILLMHIMGVQDVREFSDNAYAIDKQHGVESILIHRMLIFSLQKTLQDAYAKNFPVSA